jgi:hypothetical protein
MPGPRVIVRSTLAWNSRVITAATRKAGASSSGLPGQAHGCPVNFSFTIGLYRVPARWSMRPWESVHRCANRRRDAHGRMDHRMGPPKSSFRYCLDLAGSCGSRQGAGIRPDHDTHPDSHRSSPGVSECVSALAVERELRHAPGAADVESRHGSAVVPRRRLDEMGAGDSLPRSAAHMHIGPVLDRCRAECRGAVARLERHKDASP